MHYKQCDRRALRLATAVLFVAAAAFAGPVVSIQPATESVQAGGSFSVNIMVSGITDLYAFQFDIGFDPTILSATEVTEGAFLPMGGSTFFLPPTVNNGSGQILGTADSLLTAISGVSGSGVLATIEFHGVGGGTSAINILNGIFLDSSLSGIAETTQNGSAKVSGTPEPASALLAGCAMVGIVTLVRRRRSRFSTPVGLR